VSEPEDLPTPADLVDGEPDTDQGSSVFLAGMGLLVLVALVLLVHWLVTR